MTTPGHDVERRLAALSSQRRELLSRLLLHPDLLDSQGRGLVERERRPTDAEALPTAQVTPATSTEDNGPLTLELGSTAAEAKDGLRRFYNTVSRQLNASEFGQFAVFLNYGYVANGEREYARVELPEHYLNRNSVKLVIELIGELDLAHHRVLDVGCGRGGTAQVMDHFFRPRCIAGVDLSPVAIEFCRRQYTAPHFEFHVGDAESLPFEDNSFDVVTNIESAHCYPDVGQFYGEVRRVLRTPGYFLYTDLLPVDRIKESHKLLQALGFVVEHDRDISLNVLLSCDQIARARTAAFGGANDPNLMREFLGAPGSEGYESLRAGRWQYRIFRFRKGAAQ
jgi:SAM-dependent methyltransferase